MLQLILDGRTAVIKKGTTFTLTLENPALTDRGTYTLEVTLPLRGCPDNLRILGPLHRLETPLATDTHLTDGGIFHLISPPAIDLTGTWRVTSLTETEAKVQLTAGRSALNAAATDPLYDTERYIDELPLGNCWQDWWTARHNLSAARPDHTPQAMLAELYRAPRTESLKCLRGLPAETDAVAFPIYSDADGEEANPASRLLFQTISGTAPWDLDLTFLPLTRKSGETTAPPGGGDGTKQWAYPSDTVIAPQPYLCHVLERVIAALGFTVRWADDILRTDWRSRIFIANARGTLSLARILPHWTVKDFIEQCQAFLGITVTASTDGRRAIIRNRYDSLQALTQSGRTLRIDQVTDESTAEYDYEGETLSPTTGNIGYQFPEDQPALTLTTTLLDTLEVRELPDFAAIREALSQAVVDTDTADTATTAASASASDKERQAAPSYLYRAKDTGALFAGFPITDTDGKTRYYPRQINQLGPVIRRTDTHDLDTTLKIVPCSQELAPLTITLYQREVDKNNTNPPYKYQSAYTDKQTYLVPRLLTADTRTSSGYETIPAYQLITGQADAEKTDTTKRDVIEVALAPSADNATHPSADQEGNTLQFRQIPLPVGTRLRLPRAAGYTLADDGSPQELTALYDLGPGNGSTAADTADADISGYGDAYYHPFNLLPTIVSSTHGYTAILPQRTDTIRQAALTAPYRIDARLLRTLTILDHPATSPTQTHSEVSSHHPDPEALYIIKGRPHLCQKLELTLSPERGVHPKIKGTFIEIN